VLSDIFLSYKREDQSAARLLADALERQGWSVWWDPQLRAGERFDDVIEQALQDARCVIVLWSKRSVESKYVRDEAAYALKKDKLVPVAIDDAVLPFRFQSIQTPRLDDWTKPAGSQEFQNLVSDLTARLEPSARTEEKLQTKDDERNQRVLPRSSVRKRVLRWAMALRLNRIKVAVSISVICALAILVTTVHYPGWQETRPKPPVASVPVPNAPPRPTAQATPKEPLRPKPTGQVPAILNVQVDPDTIGARVGTHTVVTYRFKEVNGVQATVDAQDYRWLLDNGTELGSVKNARILGGSFTVGPRGSHDLLDNVYMPSDIAQKVFDAGSSQVQLETTFFGVDANGNRTKARAVLRIGILR